MESISSSICYSTTSGGYDDDGGTYSYNFRPVVVLSSNIPYDDVKDYIGDYVEYN